MFIQMQAFSHTDSPHCKYSESEKASMQPPIDVVVVKEMMTQSPFMSSSYPPPSSSSSSVLRSSRCTQLPSPPPHSVFKLKPRRPVKCSPSPAHRGRKRPATSISPAIFSTPSSANSSRDGDVASGTTAVSQDEVTTTSCTFNNDQSVCSSSSPGNGVSHAVATLQGLTLHSPSFRPTYLTQVSDGASPLSLIGHYALSSIARSSFSIYNASSPAGSSLLARNQHQQMLPALRGVPSFSPAGSTPSPKIASLTVLSHDNSPRAASCSNKQTVMVAPSSRGEAPRNSTGVDDLNLLVLETPKPPVASVQCAHRRAGSTSDSFSTIHALNDDVDGDATGITMRLPSSSRRTIADASPSRLSMSSMSERTPLPCIALTPRSDASHARRLPEFPSPLDKDVDEPMAVCDGFRSKATSAEVKLEHFGFYSTTTATGSAVPQGLFSSLESPKIQEVFLPLPEWADSSPSSSDCRLEKESGMPPKTTTTTSAISYIKAGSRSLLKPSTSTNSLVDMMARSNDPFGDDGSLCTSDDDDAFFLVPPTSIASTKEDKHPRTKLRRLLCPTTTTHGGDTRRPSVTSLTASSVDASHTSLQGMGFLTSTSSREDGLSVEHSNMARGETGGLVHRDLVTPPLMPRATSPPPLAHRPALFNNNNNNNSSELNHQ